MEISPRRQVDQRRVVVARAVAVGHVDVPTPNDLIVEGAAHSAEPDHRGAIARHLSPPYLTLRHVPDTARFAFADAAVYRSLNLVPYAIP